MTFEQAFLKVKEKFNNADASNSSDFAIQITMTDEDCGGTFYAEVKNGTLAVEPYDYYDNNLVLDITKSALLAVLSGRSSLDKAIANGDLVLSSTPKWLKKDEPLFGGTVIALPQRDDIDFPIEEHLIVELYSK